MKSVIYETKGRAREFNELAINLYTGCTHRCLYCYGPEVTHQSREQFTKSPVARVTPDQVAYSAAKWQAVGDRRQVLLCFVTDPYQPLEAETRLTRAAIEVLHEYGMGVVILTKAGTLPRRDFQLLIPGRDDFATTLTCVYDIHSQEWEPGAGLPSERIENLQIAHKLGLETWVSLEPVINPAWTYHLIRMTQDFVGHYKVGTMNYHPHRNKINWRDFGWNVKDLMDQLGVRYYLKKDLRLAMGIDSG